MKLSKLIKYLFDASEFTTPNSLASTTNQTQPFTDAFINSTKASREKEDALFHALTSDVSVDEVLAAIELIRSIRANQIEADQFL